MFQDIFVPGFQPFFFLPVMGLRGFDGLNHALQQIACFCHGRYFKLQIEFLAAIDVPHFDAQLFQLLQRKVTDHPTLHCMGLAVKAGCNGAGTQVCRPLPIGHVGSFSQFDVVVDDQFTVQSGVGIEFNPIGTRLKSSGVGFQGVVGHPPRGSAVGDDIDFAQGERIGEQRGFFDGLFEGVGAERSAGERGFGVVEQHSALEQQHSWQEDQHLC